MKVVAFNGSPRKEGNTAHLMAVLGEELGAAGVSCEVVRVGGRRVHGCTACYKCFANKDRRCSVTSDALNDWVAKMEQADGIVLASPVYFTDVTAEMKALIDRAGMVCRANGDMLRRKVGAGVAVARRGGAIHTFDTLCHFFLIGQMIIPGSSYWNLAFGGGPGEVKKDEEGVRTVQDLGRNMAWLLHKLAG